jgi:translation initiation factor IF-2
MGSNGGPTVASGSTPASARSPRRCSPCHPAAACFYSVGSSERRPPCHAPRRNVTVWLAPSTRKPSWSATRPPSICPAPSTAPALAAPGVTGQPALTGSPATAAAAPATHPGAAPGPRTLQRVTTVYDRHPRRPDRHPRRGPPPHPGHGRPQRPRGGGAAGPPGHARPSGSARSPTVTRPRRWPPSPTRGGRWIRRRRRPWSAASSAGRWTTPGRSSAS